MTRRVISVSPSTGRLVAPLLELDHFPGRAFGGPQTTALSWRRCNRQAGQRLTTAILRARGIQAGRRSAFTRW
jgi:hypothetical protein